MIYILTAIFLWSSLGIVIKLSGMPVHLLMFFSCIISVALIGLILTKKEFRQYMPKRRGIFHLFVLGLISLINTFSFFYAYKNTSVANAVLTHYTAPVIVAFLAPIFLKERLTIKVLIAVALATAGLWIMLGVSVSQFFSLVVAGDKDAGGILAGLFSGFAYAVLIIVIRILAQNFNPMIMTFFQNLFIAVVLSLFVFSTPKLLNSLTSAWWAFGVMGVVHSTIAPILYFRGMKDVTANKTAILGYLEPVCAILLSMIFLGAGLNYKTIIGGSMILFSGYLTIKA
jgi:drug/metabolite transporter (DMT)-like permease